MARRACLAIGVATVTPLKDKALRFGYLEGAVVAARTIGEWALCSGFAPENVRIVTDERVRGKDNPVTRERVQQAVDELFPAGAEVVEQLILAFCGHGLADAYVNSISWLFSDSLRLKYRVLADAFYSELLLHGVQRITLITDACREAPKDLDLMRLDPVRGIAVEGTRVDSPKFDRLAACQDGQLGYMISEPSSAAPGKCVFSGVVADVLWGKEPSAISNGVITTATFGACVRARTAERAKEYALKLDPQCLVDPEPAVLYDSANPPRGEPKLQPWPPTASASVMGVAAPPPPEKAEADLNFERVGSDDAFRLEILGPSFGEERHDLAVPSALIPLSRNSKALLQDLVALRSAPPRRPSRSAAKWRERQIQAVVDRLEADAAVEVQRRAAAGVHRSLVQLRPEESNLVVVDRGAKLWARGPVEARRRTAARAGFRVEVDPPGVPVLVELAGGEFTPVVPYSGLYVLVKRSVSDDVFQAYGQHGARQAFHSALAAITDFAAGRLAAESIDRLAAMMRSGKHGDPVLGAICAYLYRAVADRDSIRRMAYFYVRQGQPVPFDIALLGEMPVTRGADGALVLHVPAVAGREEGPGERSLPYYVTMATPETEGAIGGRCPWLAFGWDYVNLPREDSAALVEGLGDHAREVPRRGFTLLSAKSGRALAKLWGLEPR